MMYLFSYSYNYRVWGITQSIKCLPHEVWKLNLDPPNQCENDSCVGTYLYCQHYEDRTIRSLEFIGHPTSPNHQAPGSVERHYLIKGRVFVTWNPPFSFCIKLYQIIILHCYFTLPWPLLQCLSPGPVLSSLSDFSQSRSVTWEL